MLEEVVTVCLKPPAMRANLHRQQNYIILLICSVFVLVPVGIQSSLHNPLERENWSKIKAVDIMMSRVKRICILIIEMNE